MVEITQDHKHELKAISGNNNTIIDWYTDKGDWGEVDVSKIDTEDLWALRVSVQRFFHEQLAVIDDELNNWTTIHCSVCGEEDLAHRGHPFITWGLRGGHILCPRHLRAYDRMGTPRAEILKQARKEEKEILELFG